MDSRFVNGNNRSANGFFLTSSRNAKADEKEVYEEAVRFASKRLFDLKIRGSTMLANLQNLDTLSQELEGVLDIVCKRNGFEIANKTAYAYLVIMACASAYNEKIRRKLERETAPEA